MPTIDVNGTSLHYIDEGDGDEVIVFAHSFLVDHRQFDAQIEALRSRYRVIAYDHRGHGESETGGKNFSMQDIYQDGLALLDALKIDSCHWVGLSTGGFVGMRIAINHASRLRSLVLMDTSADAEPLFNRVKYSAMFAMVRVLGFAPVMSTAMQQLFGTTFLTDKSREAERQLWRKRLSDNNRVAVIRFGLGIFARQSVLSSLSQVQIPCCVVVGEEDTATPLRYAQQIAEAIPNARLEIIPDAGHLCTVVEPTRVNEVLTDFIAAHAANR